MTITHGQSQKKLTLYPPCQTFYLKIITIMDRTREEDEVFGNTIHHVLTIETALALKEMDEDTFL